MMKKINWNRLQVVEMKYLRTVKRIKKSFFKYFQLEIECLYVMMTVFSSWQDF